MKTMILILAAAAAAWAPAPSIASGGYMSGEFASPVIVRSVSDYHYRVYRFRYGMEISEDRLFGSSDRKIISAEFEFDLAVDFSRIRQEDVINSEQQGVRIVFNPEKRHFRMDPLSRVETVQYTVQTKLFGWLYSSGVRPEDWEMLEGRARQFVQTMFDLSDSIRAADTLELSRMMTTEGGPM